MNDKSEKEADFGYKKVNPNEKPDLVKGVFDSVASKYDLMNDLMSVGIHRLWKKATVQMSNLKANGSVLDVAGGTGDLAILFSEAPLTLSLLIIIASEKVAFFLISNIRFLSSASVVLLVLILNLGNLGMSLMLGSTPLLISMV